MMVSSHSSGHCSVHRPFSVPRSVPQGVSGVEVLLSFSHSLHVAWTPRLHLPHVEQCYNLHGLHVEEKMITSTSTFTSYRSQQVAVFVQACGLYPMVGMPNLRSGSGNKRGFLVLKTRKAESVAVGSGSVLTASEAAALQFGQQRSSTVFVAYEEVTRGVRCTDQRLLVMPQHFFHHRCSAVLCI
jgi:hypothetical protein